MSDGSSGRKDTVIDRLFLFGIRPFLIVMAIIIAGIYFTITGSFQGNVGSIFTGVILLILGIGLAYGFKTTGTRKITKKYYNRDTKTGKTGKARNSFGAGVKGVVDVDNEFWTAVSDEQIKEGDEITVISVEPDKVTLRVAKKR
ncbi:MAG: hypothetical protein M1117_02280 [Candidatus Thermoplasmatota archaeon]|uniref:NfeD family protein n=1 Tax=Candidatus Sysuiplasma superficiale TaxID=2823368 RepID=A0A8J7YQQ9_9ARCH|nr:NfeD family protein [Candidatus Sysuiplasma superficiale]MCL4346732.1 hypothetical protein [Candidatus Thermoplasmatota archaeon]